MLPGSQDIHSFVLKHWRSSSLIQAMKLKPLIWGSHGNRCEKSTIPRFGVARLALNMGMKIWGDRG